MLPSRSRIPASLAALLLLGLGGASEVAAQRSLASDSARRAGWSRDLERLAAELERVHPDLYHRRPKAEFVADHEALRTAIPNRDDASLALGVQRLVAGLGDAHTAANPDAAALGFRRLPISPYVFDDGVFIRDADSSAMSLIGARILAVGPLTIDTLLARLRPYIAQETEGWTLTLLPTQLVSAELLREVGATTRVDSVALELILRDGTRQRVHVATMPVSATVTWSLQRIVPLDSLPTFRRFSTSNYRYEYLERERTMYIAYNRAANDTADPLDAFAARLDDELQRRDVLRIVVDFRLNTGGNSSLFRAIERRITAYQRRHPSVELIGIIGRRTFSSGLWNAIGFQRDAGAMLYGEPAGGRPNHFGEVRQFTLPHSKMLIQHSTRVWRLVRDADPPELLPDVAVPVLASDHFALRGAVMRRILAAPR